MRRLEGMSRNTKWNVGDDLWYRTGNPSMNDLKQELRRRALNHILRWPHVYLSGDGRCYRHWDPRTAKSVAS